MGAISAPQTKLVRVLNAYKRAQGVTDADIAILSGIEETRVSAILQKSRVVPDAEEIEVLVGVLKVTTKDRERLREIIRQLENAREIWRLRHRRGETQAALVRQITRAGYVTQPSGRPLNTAALSRIETGKMALPDDLRTFLCQHFGLEQEDHRAQSQTVDIHPTDFPPDRDADWQEKTGVQNALFSLLERARILTPGPEKSPFKPSSFSTLPDQLRVLASTRTTFEFALMYLTAIAHSDEHEVTIILNEVRPENFDFLEWERALTYLLQQGKCIRYVINLPTDDPRRTLDAARYALPYFSFAGEFEVLAPVDVRVMNQLIRSKSHGVLLLHPTLSAPIEYSGVFAPKLLGHQSCQQLFTELDAIPSSLKMVVVGGIEARLQLERRRLHEKAMVEGLAHFNTNTAKTGSVRSKQPGLNKVTYIVFDNCVFLEIKDSPDAQISHHVAIHGRKTAQTFRLYHGRV